MESVNVTPTANAQHSRALRPKNAGLRQKRAWMVKKDSRACCLKNPSAVRREASWVRAQPAQKLKYRNTLTPESDSTQ